MSYDEEEDPFVMDTPSGRSGGRLCPEDEEDRDAEDEAYDDDEVDDGDEHDRHNDATDMISGRRRKTTKYFFQK